MVTRPKISRLGHQPQRNNTRDGYSFVFSPHLADWQRPFGHSKTIEQKRKKRNHQ